MIWKFFFQCSRSAPSLAKKDACFSLHGYSMLPHNSRGIDE